MASIFIIVHRIKAICTNVRCWHSCIVKIMPRGRGLTPLSSCDCRGLELVDPPFKECLSKRFSNLELRLMWNRPAEGVKAAWVAMPIRTECENNHYSALHLVCSFRRSNWSEILWSVNTNSWRTEWSVKIQRDRVFAMKLYFFCSLVAMETSATIDTTLRLLNRCYKS